MMNLKTGWEYQSRIRLTSSQKSFEIFGADHEEDHPIFPAYGVREFRTFLIPLLKKVQMNRKL